MKNNLNQLIKIKLTQEGIRLFYNSHNNFLVVNDYFKDDDKTIITMRLWEFMSIFGKNIYSGKILCEMEFEFVGDK